MLNIYIVGMDLHRPAGLFPSPYMTKELEELGCTVREIPCQELDSLLKIFEQHSSAQSLILCPMSGEIRTDVDCIKSAAELCSAPLVQDKKLAHRLENELHLSPEEAQGLALMPQSARIFPCRTSLIPGFALNGKNAHIIMLPSDAEEQISLFTSYLFDMLGKALAPHMADHVLRSMEIPVEEAENILPDLVEQDVCFAIYSRHNEIMIRLSCNLPDTEQAEQKCFQAVKTVSQHFKNRIYGVDLENIEHALAHICTEKNLRAAFAESGSAGLAFKRFRKIDSDGRLTFSSYSCRPEEMQLESLGINDKITAAFGPVSANVTAAMALGASRQADHLIGIGISLPDASLPAEKAYVSSVLGGKCLMQELCISDYSSQNQLIFDAASKALNLAQKLAEQFPQIPDQCCDAEDAVLAGMDAVKKNSSADSVDKNNGSKEEIATMPQEKTASKAPKGFKGILYRLFPNGNDSRFDKIRKILIWVCICVFIGSMTYLVNFSSQNKKSQDNLANLQDQMAQAEKDVEEGKEVDSDGYPDDYLPKFRSFYEQNSDIKGWLKIDGTNVNFPVVQTSDNEYYHRLGFNKEYDYYGTPYIDYECDVKAPSTNTIIYGHNIRNDGQMFNDLTKYKQLSFYKEHPTVTFDSVYRPGTYKIISAFITNVDPSHDNGNVFEYTHFVDAENESEFNTFVDEVRRRSMFDSPVDTKFGDELLTLSTCSYEFKEARFVVVARRVRDGEDASVDTSKVTANEDAYYPAVYAGAVEYAKKLGKVKSIAIQGSKELTMSVGDTTTLTAKVSPADAPIQTSTWDSSNSAVVTVDKNTGLVTAVGAGKANITVTADDGGFVDNISITVKPSGKELKNLSLSAQTLSLKAKGTSTLNVTLDPVDAQANLSWKSSDDSIVRIETNKTSAKVIAVNPGTATITVSTSDGSKTASCKVTVAPEETAAPTIAFEKSSITMTEGQSQVVKVNVTPSSAKVGSVFFYSDSDLIRINNGASGTDTTITALHPGTAVLFADTKGGSTTKCTIIIQPAPDNAVPVKLNLSSITLAPGDQAQMQFSVNPKGTAVTWSSSHPELVKVDSNGYVSVASGITQDVDVTIYVTARDGSSAQATVSVRVPEQNQPSDKPSDQPSDKPAEPSKPDGSQNDTDKTPVEGDLGLYAESIEMETGYRVPIPIGVAGGPNEISVKCVSGDPNVVTVDNDGNATGVGEGVTTVTITASNIKTGVFQTVVVDVVVNPRDD